MKRMLCYDSRVYLFDYFKTFCNPSCRIFALLRKLSPSAFGACALEHRGK